MFEGESIRTSGAILFGIHLPRSVLKLLIGLTAERANSV